MAGEHPGVLTAHLPHQADVEFASGRRGKLVVEDIQFLAVPHDTFLHFHNPVARHFFALSDGGRMEFVWNPGRAGHAVHGIENLAQTLRYTLRFGKMVKAIRQKHVQSGMAMGDLGTGEMDDHTYQTVDQIWDGAWAVQYGLSAKKFGAHALEDLIGWIRDNPEKGYYVVRNGHPVADPVIFHEIRRKDLY
ncbi:hypothetical protein [Streptomyces sp. NPDC006645]|uniref:hypothetical protein n=1 Tax=unclassified Streptomyces TaxID=2593676 RepID=UPI0033BD824D